MEKKLGGLPMIVFTAACALAGFLLRTAQRGGGSPAALIAVSAAVELALFLFLVSHKCRFVSKRRG